MRSIVLIKVFLLCILTGQAQSPQIKDTLLNNAEALAINITHVSKKTIEKSWKKTLKQHADQVSFKASPWAASVMRFEDETADSLTLLSKITHSKNNVVLLTWLQHQDSTLVPAADSLRFEAMRKFVFDFASSKYHDGLSKEIKTSERELNGLNYSLKSVEEEYERLERDTLRKVEHIAETEIEIEEIRAEIEMQKKQIENQQQAMSDITDPLQREIELKTLKEMKREKKKLERQVKSAKGRITSYKEAIVADKRKMKDNIKKQDLRKKEIVEKEAEIKQLQELFDQ